MLGLDFAGWGLVGIGCTAMELSDRMEGAPSSFSARKFGAVPV